MKASFQVFSSHRFRALLRKEFAQIRRDRRLAMSLILPPTLQLLLFSFVLNATVSNLKLGVIDDSRTPESRDLTSTLTESKSFRLAGYYYSVDQLGDAISRGDIDAGVVIPYDYARDLQRGQAGHGAVPAERHERQHGRDRAGLCRRSDPDLEPGLSGNGLHAQFTQVDASPVSRRGQAVLTGRFFTILGLSTLVRRHRSFRAAADPERFHRRLRCHGEGARSGHHRTIADVAGGDVRNHRRQNRAAVFAAVADGGVCAGLIKVVFDVPFHGNFLVVFCAASLCVLSGIGIWDSDRHVHAFGAAGAAHQLFRQSAAHYGFGRDHSGGGDSELAAAAGVDQSDSPFQRDCALQHDQGQRICWVVGGFSDPGRVYADPGGAQCLAVPQNAELRCDETEGGKGFAGMVKLARISHGLLGGCQV